MTTLLEGIDYNETWLVCFDIEQSPGERPVPVRLCVKERRSGRQRRIEESELRGSGPPYALGPDALFVTYDAPLTLGCHLSLGWPIPANVLDLYAEFRCETAGLLEPGDYSLKDALAYYGLHGDSLDGLELLLTRLLPSVSLPHALLRGRYTRALARIESQGVPMDTHSLSILRGGWDQIRQRLIDEVDLRYGVFDGDKFNPVRWRIWVNRRRIRWPRVRGRPGYLHLDHDTFDDMAAAYPEVRPMKDLLKSLALLKPKQLPVGNDGRNRCSIRPFAAKTGRNAPSPNKCIFGPGTWVRGLIKPEPGRAVAYIDYGQQEIGVAAALSGDKAMIEAYLLGDPYLNFAKLTGAVPEEATKKTHYQQREQYKQCLLSILYGMGAWSLAGRLRVTIAEAQHILNVHHTKYATYHQWRKEIKHLAFKQGKLDSPSGWTLHVQENDNPLSVQNFPVQAAGADMLRLACIALTEAGVAVGLPVHDALLIEASADGIDQAVRACQEAMETASEHVLRRLRLRTDVTIVRHPDRYKDGRGRAMWQRVFKLLNEDGIAASY